MQYSMGITSEIGFTRENDEIRINIGPTRSRFRVIRNRGFDNINEIKIYGVVKLLNNYLF